MLTFILPTGEWECHQNESCRETPIRLKIPKKDNEKNKALRICSQFSDDFLRAVGFFVVFYISSMVQSQGPEHWHP